jgi:hypothetical protein
MNIDAHTMELIEKIIMTYSRSAKRRGFWREAQQPCLRQGLTTTIPRDNVLPL